MKAPQTQTTSKQPAGEGSLAEIEAMIGRPLRIEQWNHQATADAIRHYAWGIGDDNPLYSDPGHASSSRFGTIVAPPTFPYSVYDGVIAPGLPGHSWFYAGADWQFHRPVLLGASIKATAELLKVRQTSSGRVPDMLVQTGRTTYADLEGNELATLDAHCFRVPLRKDGKGGMPFQHRPQHRYTADDLRAIEELVLGEYRRGSSNLQWDAIAVGEDLPRIARGPLSPIDMSTYYAGAIGTAGYKSTKMRWIYRHLALTDPSQLPETLPPEYFVQGLSASMGHTDPKAAAEGGMPGAYDNGLQRIGFMTTLVTNWMGDCALLRSISIRIKAPVIFGDTTFVTGRVTGKRREDDRELVDLMLDAENQFGELTASGTATVELAPR